MINGRKVITLCGSTRFKEEFEKWNRELTLRGNVVFSCAVFTHADGIPISKVEVDILSQAHYSKIDLSDGIFVINVDGYIGESTRKEIHYAWLKKKMIEYLNPLKIHEGSF